MKYIVKKFDSLNEYSRYLKSDMSDLFKKYGHAASEECTKSFTGTSSFEEADNMLKFGDLENLKKIKAELSKIQVNGGGETKYTETYRSFVGYAPHVPSYVSGQPKTMLRKRVVRETDVKIVNIMYSSAASCGVDARDILETSVNVMNFIHSLEKQGYSVNLYTMIATSKGNETVSQIVKIKSSDDYTNLSKVVYPMVNPSFLRRHFFKFMEVTEGITNKDFCHSYGLPVYLKSEVQPIWEQVGIRIDYYFDFYEAEYQLKQYTKQINK